jgi:hypothetical protein
MTRLDWKHTPLEDFIGVNETQEDGCVRYVAHPHGDGVAQEVMMSIAGHVQYVYETLLSDEDGERYERAGEVPIIRGGRMVYEPVDSLTLADLPVILDTLATMDEKAKAMDEEERKRRRNALSRERRKLKKLGEW